MEKLAEQAICKMVATKRLADIQDICDTLVNLYGDKAADWTLDEVFRAALKREEALEKKDSHTQTVEHKKEAPRASVARALEISSRFSGHGEFSAEEARAALCLSKDKWNNARDEAVRSGLWVMRGCKRAARYEVAP